MRAFAPGIRNRPSVLIPMREDRITMKLVYIYDKNMRKYKQTTL